MAGRRYSNDQPFDTSRSSSSSPSSPFGRGRPSDSGHFDPFASPAALDSYRFPSSLPPLPPLSRVGSVPSAYTTSYGYPGSPQDPVVEKRVPSTRSRMSPIGPPPTMPLPPLPTEAGGSAAGRYPSLSPLPPLSTSGSRSGRSTAFPPASTSSSGGIGFSMNATPPLIDERSPSDNSNSVFCSICNRFRDRRDIKLLPSGNQICSMCAGSPGGFSSRPPVSPTRRKLSRRSSTTERPSSVLFPSSGDDSSFPSLPPLQSSGSSSAWNRITGMSSRRGSLSGDFGSMSMEDSGQSSSWQMPSLSRSTSTSPGLFSSLSRSRRSSTAGISGGPSFGDSSMNSSFAGRRSFDSQTSYLNMGGEEEDPFSQSYTGGGRSSRRRSFLGGLPPFPSLGTK